MGHALRERRKNRTRRASRRPDMAYSSYLDATTPDAMGPKPAKRKQRSDSCQGDEPHHQISILGSIASGYAKKQANMEHFRFFQDQKITTASAVNQVLEMTSGYTLDDTDLPENFDIDSIF